MPKITLMAYNNHLVWQWSSYPDNLDMLLGDMLLNSDLWFRVEIVNGHHA